MTTDITAPLADSFIKVIEQMAFMFTEPATPYDFSPDDTIKLTATMAFSGAVSGNLSLATNAALGRELAGNMLGIEPTEPEAEEKSKDALKEALNTFCGNFLIAWKGETAVFDLTPPVIQDLNEDGWRGVMNDHSYMCFRVEDQPVLIKAEITSA